MSEPRTRRGAREEETPDVGAPQTPSAADKSKGWENLPKTQPSSEQPHGPGAGPSQRVHARQGRCAEGCKGGTGIKSWHESWHESCINCKEVHDDAGQAPRRGRPRVDTAQDLADKGGTSKEAQPWSA
jgi:hypothetical protein